MTTRRTFIQVIPVSGAVMGTVMGGILLAACSDKAPPPAATPAAAPPPPAAPVAAAPAAAAPAAAPPPATASAPAGAGAAAGGPMVDEKDATAVALGYVADASQVDKAKYANFTAGQNCAGCALYQGGAAPAGGCALFAGKQVSAKGWCSAFAKKAA